MSATREILNMLNICIIVLHRKIYLSKILHCFEQKRAESQPLRVLSSTQFTEQFVFPQYELWESWKWLNYYSASGTVSDTGDGQQSAHLDPPLCICFSDHLPLCVRPVPLLAWAACYTLYRLEYSTCRKKLFTEYHKIYPWHLATLCHCRDKDFYLKKQNQTPPTHTTPSSPHTHKPPKTQPNRKPPTNISSVSPREQGGVASSNENAWFTAVVNSIWPFRNGSVCSMCGLNPFLKKHKCFVFEKWKSTNITKLC